MITYDDVLDAVDNFNSDDKIEISEIIKKRAIEERRNQIKEEINLSREELNSGKIKPQSIDKIITEIES